MIAKVIVDIATTELDRIFDYEIGYSGAVTGSRVIVPFGKFKTEGFVIDVNETSDYPEDKLKSIIKQTSFPQISLIGLSRVPNKKRYLSSFLALVNQKSLFSK